MIAEITTKGKYDYWILDLSQTALHSLLSVWSMELGELSVVVDESKPLKELVERNHLFRSLKDKLVYFDPFGDGETALNFTLKNDIDFRKSKGSFGLQLADLFASSKNWSLLNPGVEIAFIVNSYSNDYISQPNNVCISPEPWVYLKPDSIEFDLGRYSLYKLVELSGNRTKT